MQEEFQLALFKNRKKENLFANRVINVCPFWFHVVIAPIYFQIKRPYDDSCMPCGATITFLRSSLR